MTAESLGSVGHYTLLERLDPAGPGDLYRARDGHHGRTVVVRWLPPDAGFGPFGPDALVSNLRRLSAFSHPNVTAVFDAGIQDQRAFVVFELVSGPSLRAEAAGRPMSVRAALDVAIQLADAVAAVHGAGYAHSGISPDSIVVSTKGRTKIPAFELTSRTGFADASGSRLIDYESPEELRGEPPDERSDVFSTGAVLYELLTARRPSLRGASAPSASNPQVPAELDRVLLKAIQPNPDQRCPGAAALAGELRGIVAALDSPAEEPRKRSWVQRLLGG